MKIKNFIGIIFLVFVIGVFYRPIFSLTKVPVPTDTLVNLFNPFRDFYASTFPRGVPYKNPLVGDPILQQIPARQLSIEVLKKAELPLWNPYQMAGYPLLANIQSAPFYPLNIIFFFIPFLPAWTIFIIFEQLLAGIFMFLYLRNRKLSEEASLFGALSFSFCGFIIAWLEWGTISHTALWIPLSLFAVDKILDGKKKLWYLLLGVSVIFSFLAGHLQTFIYGLALVLIYFFYYWCQGIRNKKILGLSLLTLFIALIITFPVWYSQLNLILLSARNVDLSWQKSGWFIPLAQLVQFFFPDFFGNPATGNYWGVFNYGEFIGYIGIAPLILGVLALFSKRKKEVLFWGGLVVLSLLFASQNIFAELPYKFSIPFFSSAQPTRLLIITDISLAILAAYGFETFLKSEKRKLLPKIVIILGIFIAVFYGFTYFSSRSFLVADFAVTKHNLIIPTFLFVTTGIILVLGSIFDQRKKYLLMISLIAISALDLLFFASKYTPFASKNYFYPTTKTISFLQKQPGQFRIMTTTRQIFSPNIATMYHLQSVDGYDPLYLMRFGQMMIASERGKSDISTPFGFNRIVVSNKISSPIVDLLGVKYILSLTERDDPGLTKVFEEGQTKIYQNNASFPRTFFVDRVVKAGSSQSAIDLMFDKTIDLRRTGIVEDLDNFEDSYSSGSLKITRYTPNNISIQTKNSGKGFLIITDTYYPTWKAYIDKKQVKIYRTDFNFRGIVVPSGIHTVEFRDTLL